MEHISLYHQLFIMATYTHTSLQDKQAALELLRANVSRETICKNLQISKSTLYRITRAAVQQGGRMMAQEFKRRQVGSKRKNVITADQKVAIEREARINPQIYAKEIKARIPSITVGVKSVQKFLRSIGLRSRRMAKKPKLSDKMKAKRLAFAEKHKQWTEEQWSKVMFSDESNFVLSTGGRTMCRRPRGSDRYDEKYTVKTTRHSQKLMMWGSFCAGGVGDIVFLEKGQTMNGKCYRDKVLSKKLPASMKKNDCTHFLQDGAPCHTCGLVKTWFQNHPEIQLMDWPGNSPDLNPIENCWAWMKNKMKEKNPADLEEMREGIKDLWKNRMEDGVYLRKLVESMPRRMAKVIEMDGQMTKY